MDRNEFYKIGLASGWLDKGEMCGGISAIDRAVAVQAIAARSSGTPEEAAAQILSGIAALDSGPLNPVVVRWPQGFDEHYYLIKRAEWHIAEASKLNDQHKCFVSSFMSPGQHPVSAPNQDLGSGNAPHHPKTRHAHVGTDQDSEALNSEPSKSDQLQEPPLFGGTNDAFE